MDNCNNIINRIIKDLECDCDHYSKCGYDGWKPFLSDANTDDIDEYNKVLYEDFTEEELEEIWQRSHK